MNELRGWPELALVFEPAEAASWSKWLNRTARPCGCKSGAAMTLAALVGWPAMFLLASGGRSAREIVVAVVTYPFVVLAGALAGKIAGIVAGRATHSWLRRRLQRRLASIGPGRGV